MVSDHAWKDYYRTLDREIQRDRQCEIFRVSNSARYLAPHFLQQNITPQVTSWSVLFYF